MKNLLIMAALATFMLFSCTEEEVQDNVNDITVSNPITPGVKAALCNGKFDDSNCSQDETCCLGEVVVSPAAYNAVLAAAANITSQMAYFQGNDETYMDVMSADMLQGLINGTLDFNFVHSTPAVKYFSVDDGRTRLKVLPYKIN